MKPHIPFLTGIQHIVIGKLDGAIGDPGTGDDVWTSNKRATMSIYTRDITSDDPHTDRADSGANIEVVNRIPGQTGNEGDICMALWNEYEWLWLPLEC